MDQAISELLERAHTFCEAHYHRYQEDKWKRIKHYIMTSYRGGALSAREKARRVYGRLRSLGWKPKRER